MPVSINKIKGGYSVRTPSAIHAKKTTLKKAMAQRRLLNALEHDPEFKNKLRAKMLKKGN